MYHGKGPSLRHGVACKFNNTMECIAICSGLDYNFFKRLTANSNQFARQHMNVEGNYTVSQWSNISVQEMIHFFGLILKMSVDDRQLGGYQSYFTKKRSINLSRYYAIELQDMPSWARTNKSKHHSILK